MRPSSRIAQHLYARPVVTIPGVKDVHACRRWLPKVVEIDGQVSLVYVISRERERLFSVDLTESALTS